MFQFVRIILIETSHSGNIGAVARAMRNMGVSRLFLVNPRANWKNKEAIGRSSGAQDVLENITVVDSLLKAISDCSRVYGASARQRTLEWPSLSCRAAAQEIRELSQQQPNHEVALVFGREDRGLSNDELQACHAHLHIPTCGDFASLNLAMAVQIVCYDLRMAFLLASDERTSEEKLNKNQLESLTGASHKEKTTWREELASVDEAERMLAHFETVLVESEFLDPANPRQLLTRLRRLFYRSNLRKMEVNILRGFLAAVQKKIAVANKEAHRNDKVIVKASSLIDDEN